MHLREPTHPSLPKPGSFHGKPCLYQSALPEGQGVWPFPRGSLMSHHCSPAGTCHHHGCPAPLLMNGIRCRLWAASPAGNVGAALQSSESCKPAPLQTLGPPRSLSGVRGAGGSHRAGFAEEGPLGGRKSACPSSPCGTRGALSQTQQELPLVSEPLCRGQLTAARLCL